MPNMLKHMSVIYKLGDFKSYSTVWYLLYVLLGCFMDILVRINIVYKTTLVYIPALPYLLKHLVLRAA